MLQNALRNARLSTIVQVSQQILFILNSQLAQEESGIISLRPGSPILD